MAGAGALRSGSATDASTDGARPADRVSTSTAVCTERGEVGSHLLLLPGSVHVDLMRPER